MAAETQWPVMGEEACVLSYPSQSEREQPQPRSTERSSGIKLNFYFEMSTRDGEKNKGREEASVSREDS